MNKPKMVKKAVYKLEPFEVEQWI